MDDFLLLITLCVITLIVLIAVTPVLTDMIAEQYNIVSNLSVTQFIKNLPDESYIIYENGDFYIRYIHKRLEDYTNHEKLILFEELKLGEPITMDIPLKMRTNFIYLYNTYNEAGIIKRNNFLFLTNNIDFFITENNNYIGTNTYSFEASKNIDEWFKLFYKENNIISN